MVNNDPLLDTSEVPTNYEPPLRINFPFARYDGYLKFSFESVSSPKWEWLIVPDRTVRTFTQNFPIGQLGLTVVFLQNIKLRQ